MAEHQQPQLLLIASKNKGKVQEFMRILELFQAEQFWHLQLAFAWYAEKTGRELQDIPETGNSFADNARIKSEAIAQITGQWALADDSGLVVPALHDAPGVFSARYGGFGTDQERNEFLLRNMQGITDRRAYFQIVLSLSHPCGKQVQAFTGQVHGRILEDVQGKHGFGYDPLFQPEGFAVSMAQLSPEQKDGISHRGQALRQFIAWTKAQSQEIMERL